MMSRQATPTFVIAVSKGQHSEQSLDSSHPFILSFRHVVQYDGRSMALESGRYMETVGTCHGHVLCTSTSPFSHCLSK